MLKVNRRMSEPCSQKKKLLYYKTMEETTFDCPKSSSGSFLGHKSAHIISICQCLPVLEYLRRR